MVGHSASWIGRPGWWFHFLRRGIGRSAPTIGDHTSQPPRESPFPGTGEEGTANIGTLDSGGTVRFCPGCGTLNQLHTLHLVLEGVHGNLENSLNHVPRSVLWRSPGVGGRRPSVKGRPGPSMTRLGVWFTLPAVSQTYSLCMLDSSRAALCHWFCSLFSMDRMVCRSHDLRGSL